MPFKIPALILQISNSVLAIASYLLFSTWRVWAEVISYALRSLSAHKIFLRSYEQISFLKHR